jgi:hypothetical protein
MKDKQYYSLEGYPCSKEHAEREAQAMKDAMPKLDNKFKFKLPIIYGTGGEISIPATTWQDNLKRDLTEEEVIQEATEAFKKQTNANFITHSLTGYIEFHKACRLLVIEQLKIKT